MIDPSVIDQNHAATMKSQVMNASRASQNKFGATETMKTQKALLTHQILEKQGSKMDETQNTNVP